MNRESESGSICGPKDSPWCFSGSRKVQSPPRPFLRKKSSGSFFCFRYFVCSCHKACLPAPHFIPSCASHKLPPPFPLALFWCVLVDVILLMPILCALNLLFSLALLALHDSVCRSLQAYCAARPCDRSHSNPSTGLDLTSVS
jgi:hypothetical protein